MNIEDMFTMETDPINKWIKDVAKRTEMDLAYFVLSRTDYDLANYDIRQVVKHKECGTVLWFGFEIETTRRVTPRTKDEVRKVRELAVDVLRRNKENE